MAAASHNRCVSDDLRSPPPQTLLLRTAACLPIAEVGDPRLETCCVASLTNIKVAPLSLLALVGLFVRCNLPAMISKTTEGVRQNVSFGSSCGSCERPKQRYVIQ